MSRNDKVAAEEIERLNAIIDEIQEELELALKDNNSLRAQLNLLLVDRQASI